MPLEPHVPKIESKIVRNIYEKLFMLNWPMFEKITEKVVHAQARQTSNDQICWEVSGADSLLLSFRVR